MSQDGKFHEDQNLFFKNQFEILQLKNAKSKIKNSIYMLKQIGECIKQPILNKRGRSLDLIFLKKNN